jgi:phytoene dehydrogenase-like protein
MEYDGIIVGGGHNGLICASYLAKAGLKIAVIERNDAMGGGCTTSEFVAPGFKHNSHYTAASRTLLNPSRVSRKTTPSVTKSSASGSSPKWAR